MDEEEKLCECCLHKDEWYFYHINKKLDKSIELLQSIHDKLPFP